MLRSHTARQIDSNKNQLPHSLTRLNHSPILCNDYFYISPIILKILIFLPPFLVMHLYHTSQRTWDSRFLWEKLISIDYQYKNLPTVEILTSFDFTLEELLIYFWEQSLWLSPQKKPVIFNLFYWVSTCKLNFY